MNVLPLGSGFLQYEVWFCKSTRRCRKSDSPSSVNVKLDDMPSVLVTTQEKVPRSSKEGSLKMALDLHAHMQRLDHMDAFTKVAASL